VNVLVKQKERVEKRDVMGGSVNGERQKTVKAQHTKGE
jgi:hypothetical protein